MSRLLFVSVLCVVAGACSKTRPPVGHVGGGAGGHGGGGEGGEGGEGGAGGSNTGGTGGSGGIPLPPDPDCPPGKTTALEGTVFAPNGTLPLYNATVYVPKEPPKPITQGASCDRCTSAASKARTVVLSDADGKFRLEKVPPGKDIPVVIELGKWRRQITIPSVQACETTKVDAALTHLPKSRHEGDMPKIAIVTGLADPFECLLLKVGIDAAEITEPTGDGQVHFFQSLHAGGGVMSANTPTGDKLLESADALRRYDVVILPCEGKEVDQGASARKNIAGYLDLGGRVFTTHFSYSWWDYDGSAFRATGNWAKDTGIPVYGMPPPATIVGEVNTKFPKGLAFSKWLTAAGMSGQSAPGKLEIRDYRFNIKSIDPKLAQDWINYHWAIPNLKMTIDSVQHLTFNTPLAPPVDDMGKPLYCGRAVFSSFHVTAGTLKGGGGVPDMGGWHFPESCDLSKMIDQEKALAFMLFDLSSCVQADDEQPIP